MPRLISSGWKKGDLRIWSGELDNIPKGWELAADMVDRAVVGAGGSYAKGQKFGVDSRTPTKPSVSVSINNHTLSAAQIAAHKHNQTALPNFIAEAKALSGDASPRKKTYSNYVVSNIDTGIQNTGSSAPHLHGTSVSVGNVGAVVTRQQSIAVIWIRKI